MHVSLLRDSLWYSYLGAICVPISFTSGVSTFFFKVECISPNDKYMTFNKDSTTLFTEYN